MWIFGSNHFVSMVQDRADPSMVICRARRESDLLNFFSGTDYPYSIEHTIRNDYHYRALIPKTVLGTILASLATRVKYPNFKDSIADEEDDDLYHFAAETWNSGYRNLAEAIPTKKK